MKFFIYLFLMSAAVSTTAFSQDQNITQESKHQIGSIVDGMLSGKPTKAFQTYAAELIELLPKSGCTYYTYLQDSLKMVSAIASNRPVSVIKSWETSELLAALWSLNLPSPTHKFPSLHPYLTNIYILMNFVPDNPEFSLENLEKKAEQEIKKIAVIAASRKKTN